MKNNSLHRVNFLLTFIIVILCCIFFFIRENKRLKTQVLSLVRIYQGFIDNNRKSLLRDFELHSFTNTIFTPHYKLFDSKGSGSYLLVYFYAGGECETCIFDDIDKIRKIILVQYPDDVYIFPVFNTSREIEIKLKTDLKGLPYSRLDRNEIVFPLWKETEARFFAILTPEGSLINYFFPDINMPEKTKVYLRFIKEKYLKDNS